MALICIIVDLTKIPYYLVFSFVLNACRFQLSPMHVHYYYGQIEFIPLVGSPSTDLPLILENTRSCPALTAPLAFLPFRHVSVQSAPFDRKRRVTLDIFALVAANFSTPSSSSSSHEKQRKGRRGQIGGGNGTREKKEPVRMASSGSASFSPTTKNVSNMVWSCFSTLLDILGFKARVCDILGEI